MFGWTNYLIMESLADSDKKAGFIIVHNEVFWVLFGIYHGLEKLRGVAFNVYLDYKRLSRLLKGNIPSCMFLELKVEDIFNCMWYIGNYEYKISCK